MISNGIVSHVPHIIASSLVHLSSSHANDHAFSQTASAGGFRDITRIASSNAEMWKDISLSNKQNIISLLEDMQTNIKDMIVKLKMKKNNKYINSLKMQKFLEINYLLSNMV